MKMGHLQKLRSGQESRPTHLLRKLECKEKVQVTNEDSHKFQDATATIKMNLNSSEIKTQK